MPSPSDMVTEESIADEAPLMSTESLPAPVAICVTDPGSIVPVIVSIPSPPSIEPLAPERTIVSLPKPPLIFVLIAVLVIVSCPWPPSISVPGVLVSKLSLLLLPSSLSNVPLRVKVLPVKTVCATIPVLVLRLSFTPD